MLILTLPAIKYCKSILLEFLYCKFLSGQKKKTPSNPTVSNNLYRLSVFVYSFFDDDLWKVTDSSVYQPGVTAVRENRSK
jgi:hypothetical protein